MATDVVVVGAGLAGLACAGALEAAGLAVTVIEASGRPGGRIGGHARPDGHVIDRGFQVHFEAYPTARRLLRDAAIDWKAYDAGALVRVGGGWQAISDPARHPADWLSSLSAGVASPADTWAFGRLGVECLLSDPPPPVPPETTARYWKAIGFSDGLIDRFLRPFFAGIWLDRTLDVDANLFRFYWRMLLLGRAVVPAGGMQQLPDALASRLKPGTLRVETPVAALRRDGAAVTGVTTADGEAVESAFVVLATPHPETARLLERPATRSGKAALTLYFEADVPPTDRKLIMLSPDAGSPIGVVAVPSNVSAAYAPPGKHQVAVQVLPTEPGGAPALAPEAALEILAGWFPHARPRGWRFLEAVSVPFGQLDQSPGAAKSAVRAGANLFLAGEAATQSSIEGALSSGLATAEALLAAMPGRVPAGSPGA
ncbi:15-cis-phytoene desaturase [compost metagenome]